MNPGFPENMEGDLGQKNNDNTLFDFNLLQTLIAQNFKQVSLDRNVEEILVDMSNEFLENLLELSTNMAKHRGSDALDSKDIKIAFKLQSNVKLTSRPFEELKILKAQSKNLNHLQRLNFINTQNKN